MKGRASMVRSACLGGPDSLGSGSPHWWPSPGPFCIGPKPGVAFPAVAGIPVMQLMTVPAFPPHVSPLSLTHGLGPCVIAAVRWGLLGSPPIAVVILQSHEAWTEDTAHLYCQWQNIPSCETVLELRRRVQARLADPLTYIVARLCCRRTLISFFLGFRGQIYPSSSKGIPEAGLGEQKWRFPSVENRGENLGTPDLD